MLQAIFHSLSKPTIPYHVSLQFAASERSAFSRHKISLQAFSPVLPASESFAVRLDHIEMHLLGVHSSLPAIHDYVVQLQVIQTMRIEAKVQVHEAAVQWYVLQWALFFLLSSLISHIAWDWALT